MLSSFESQQHHRTSVFCFSVCPGMSRTACNLPLPEAHSSASLSSFQLSQLEIPEENTAKSLQTHYDRQFSQLWVFEQCWCWRLSWRIDQLHQDTVTPEIKHKLKVQSQAFQVIHRQFLSNSGHPALAKHRHHCNKAALIFQHRTNFSSKWKALETAGRLTNRETNSPCRQTAAEQDNNCFITILLLAEYRWRWLKWSCNLQFCW